MHSLITLLVLVGVTMGAPQQQGYNYQAPSSNSQQPGGGVSISVAQPSFGTSRPSNNNGGGISLGSVNGNAGQSGFIGGNTNGGGNAGQNGYVNGNVVGGGNGGPVQPPTTSPVNCAEGEVLHVDGKCVKPIISRNIYVYAAPEVPQQVGPAPELPQPKVEYNIVFVRTPEAGEGAEPIIIPPPQQKTLVYVLSKKGSATGPQIIEVPAGPDHQPEVYYVNYADGENPTLPGGVDLQQALSAAATTGQIIGGGAGTGIGGNSAGLGGAAGLGAGTGTGIGGSSTGNGGQSSNGFGGSGQSGNFGGSGQGSNLGGSGQGQGGNYVAPSSGGNFASSSSSNSFSSSSNSNSNSNSFSSNNFISGSQGNGGGFNPSVQQSQAQAPAPQAPSSLYIRPN